MKELLTSDALVATELMLMLGEMADSGLALNPKCLPLPE